MASVTPQRVAFEAARVLVTIAGTELCWWVFGEVSRCLGTPWETRLMETRLRLLREDAYYREAGCWRVLLEEEIREHPDVSDCLYRIVRSAAPLLD
ncbi:MAG TPA: hypothetical protein VHA75_18990 [Rugosimonospora sp.]|jgi:hypothetical protein|nr:hypothetical protein [Rugosimonospora sp.]